MSRQVIWNKHEVALLIDAYLKVTAKKAEKLPMLKELSHRLRAMAINAGAEIDDTYRNLNGMQWQYVFIEKAFIEKGIGSHMPPKLFLEMVRIYKTQPDVFNMVLSEAYKLSEVPVVDRQNDSRNVEGANMTDNKTEFQDWLQKQPRIKQPVGWIMSILSECSDYAVARHIAKTPFWNMTNVAQYMDVSRKLQGLRLFRVMHRKTALAFDKTYTYYSSFLKEKTANKSVEKNEKLVEQGDFFPVAVASVSGNNPTLEANVPVIDDKSPLRVDFNSNEKYAYTSPIWFTYFEGDRCVVDSWNDLYVRVMQELIGDYPLIFEELKGKNIAKGQRVEFSETAEFLRSPKLIRANYYAETNLSAYDIVKHIKLLLDMCNVDYDNLVIEYRQKLDAEKFETSKNPSSELIRCEADKEIFEKYPILPTRIAEILKAAEEPLSADEIVRRLGQACRMSSLRQILSTVSWAENDSWKYRYIPVCTDGQMAANIRRRDNLLARVEMLKSAFPEFVFTNMNAKGEVVERAIYIYPLEMERRGNVFFEIWHLSTEGQFDLYMKRPLLTNEEYQESIESWDKTNESRGRITRKWTSYEDLLEYLRTKLSIARDNLNQVTIPSKTPQENPLLSKMEQIVLRADMDGMSYDDLKDTLQITMVLTKQLVSQSTKIVEIKGVLIHEEAFVDWEDGADELEAIIEKLMLKNNGYISSTQLFEYARIEMNMFLNDNDIREERAVYDMAQHLFEKEHYHEKYYAFRGKTHISRADAGIGSNMDVYKKYATDQGGVFSFNGLVEYLESIGVSIGNLRNQMKMWTEPTFFFYDDDTVAMAEALRIDDEWKKSITQSLKVLFDDAGNHIILRNIPSIWFDRLPAISGNRSWTPLLLQSVLRFYGKELGARTIQALEGQALETVHTMLVVNDSPIQNFGDVVISYLLEQNIERRKFEAEELRLMLVNGGILHGNELICNMPKALKSDGRFAWDASGNQVTVKI